MEQEVLFKDVVPYLQLWSGSIVFVLLVMLYYLSRFRAQHPEIFQPDRLGGTKRYLSQKNELRRWYYNTSVLSIALMFVWAIGVMVICYGFSRERLFLFMIIFLVIIILWVASFVKR